jgi:hypothetical protein
MSLQFGFVFFWQNEIGAKADRKMLVKFDFWLFLSYQFSISSIFVRKCFAQILMSLQFGFVVFSWQNEIGAKADRKMLVKFYC